jgi:hypothetical protein
VSGESLMTFSVGADDDLPAKLRLAAATAPEIQMTFCPVAALKLARRIEDTRPVVLVVEVERVVSPVIWFWALCLGLALMEGVQWFAQALLRMLQ